MDSAPLLPLAATPEAWDTLLGDDAALRPGVLAIARRHRIAVDEARGAQRYDSGSLPVYALSEGTVLKLYPPEDAAHAEVEAQVLAFVDDRLPVATPRVIATGAQDGWRYLLMTRLRGRRLVEAWTDLDGRGRERVAEQTGAALGALHALDGTALRAIEPDWDDFVAAQRASAVERQRARRLAPQWLERIEPFLDAWMPEAPPRRALLHTEVMREHLMVDVAPAGGGVALTGLFDFEPAMTGHPDYEFASVGLFVTCGDARLLRRLMLAYGRRAADLDDDALPCRLMAHALLHRYSNLRWYLERLPAPGATTLEDLARAWWTARARPGAAGRPATST